MFFNVSPNPSWCWPREQLVAAGSGIVDLPFPVVPPRATEDEVREIALRLVENIAAAVASARQELGPQSCTVLIDGPPTFTYRVVYLLFWQHDIRCVAPVFEEVDIGVSASNPPFRGKKFVQFRHYM
jgi:hypothetical protein